MIRAKNKARLLAALPATIRELEQELGSHNKTVWCWIMDLKQSREVRICGYEREGRPTSGPWAPIYARGKTRDAEKPVPISKQENWRRYAARRTQKHWFSTLEDLHGHV